jgi:hypothetical protein
MAHSRRGGAGFVPRIFVSRANIKHKLSLVMNITYAY